MANFGFWYIIVRDSERSLYLWVFFIFWNSTSSIGTLEGKRSANNLANLKIKIIFLNFLHLLAPIAQRVENRLPMKRDFFLGHVRSYLNSSLADSLPTFFRKNLLLFWVLQTYIRPEVQWVEINRLIRDFFLFSCTHLYPNLCKLLTKYPVMVNTRNMS